MDPHVREDDGVRELIGTTHLSFPCIRESIHPHAAEATFGNALTATDNDESETNNAENEVPKTSHGARYTMDPRVREDDEVRV